MAVFSEVMKMQRFHWKNVVTELINGQKETHWCWYFLPNVPGLGQSENAVRFAVSPEEFYNFMNYSEYAGNIFTVIHLIDRAYRKHHRFDMKMVLGEVDTLKWCSFMTLVREMYKTGAVDVTDSLHSIVIGSDHHGVCEHTRKTVADFSTQYWR